MKTDRIESLKAAVSSIEQTAEGQLRGGFAVIGGGGTTDPLGNTKCIDIACNNYGCNNNGCNDCIGGPENFGCYNDGCNGNCVITAVSGGQTMSLGMTFSI